MYKKILSLILVLCLSMGNFTNATVYAEENDENKVISIENNGEDGQQIPEGDDIIIPQNGSEVYIEGMETQPATFDLRTSGETSDERYIILVLDNAPATKFKYNEQVIYKADTALPYVKEASKKFIADISEASGDNYIAIIAFNNNGCEILSQFTNDTDALNDVINSLHVTGGGRDVHKCFSAARQLMNGAPNQDAKKNIVLFTTGMTNTGIYDYTGPYYNSTVGSGWMNSATGVNLYAYANAAYAVAKELKEKCTIYSIGLFNVLEDMPERGRDIVQFFKLSACDWASSKDHFYDVKDPADLEFVFGQVADNIVKKTGTFSYTGTTDGDYTAEYYYDDNYFEESSYEYNQQLATMSLCLELSAWGSKEEPDYTKKMKNAETLLNELGFVGFGHNYTDFSEDGISGKPTKDSVGVVVANKQVSFDDRDYTLIAVAVRGGEYEREWASNFKIGASGNHEGFSEARDIVLAFLENYIKEQGISGDIKLWITGYSRAAATANMTAGAIDNGNIDLDDCNLELKDVFAYTFETPAGVVEAGARDSKYNNIFNIININDPVPMVAPSDWGFMRYGVDKHISTPEVDGKDAYRKNVTAMLKRYQEMGGYEGYVVDDFKMKKIKIDGSDILPGDEPFANIIDDKEDNRSQGAFLDSYINILAKNYIKNRSKYVKKYQDGIRDACGIFFGTESEKTEKLFRLVKEKFSKNWGWLICEHLKPYGGTDAVYKRVSKYLKECLDEAEITNYSQDDFEKSVTILLDLVVSVASRHPNLTTTLVFNLSGIGQAHYPELCLAWMQSMDENYTTDAEGSFSTGKYRIVRINCPIDVTVYDAGGNVLASIIDDMPQPDSHVVVSFTDEGEKLVYLPVNHDYEIKLSATDDGVMNYAVQEYDPNAGETNHMVLFHDIEIKEGQEFRAYLPSYSTADTESRTGTAAGTAYTLFLGETQIPLSEELTNEAVFNAYYNVDASADNSEKGIVFGSGIWQYGTFAKVTAIAYEGYEFDGWYEGDNRVSSEAEYRFRVSKDIGLVAVFKESSEDKTPEEKPDEGKEEDTETEDKHEGTMEGTFKVNSHWNTGFSGEITLKNTTDEVIHNWVVAFDLPYDIVNIWNGVIDSYEDGVYTVKNSGYNWDIQPGESVTFGFNANAETETITEPTYYTLIEKPAKVVEEDYEIVYKVNSDWGTAFNGQLEISNVSSGEIFDWILEFDSEHNFNQFWDAEIVSHEGNHYVIKNKGYNVTIGAGQTLTLGFEASRGSEDSSQEPTNYNLTTVDMNNM